jgi:hypothetical protein
MRYETVQVPSTAEVLILMLCHVRTGMRYETVQVPSTCTDTYALTRAYAIRDSLFLRGIFVFFVLYSQPQNSEDHFFDSAY